MELSIKDRVIILHGLFVRIGSMADLTMQKGIENVIGFTEEESNKLRIFTSQDGIISVDTGLMGVENTRSQDYTITEDQREYIVSRIQKLDSENNISYDCLDTCMKFVR